MDTATVGVALTAIQLLVQIATELKGKDEAKKLDEALSSFFRAELRASGEALQVAKSSQIRLGEMLEILKRLDAQTAPQVVEYLQRLTATPSEIHGLPSPKAKPDTDEWFRIQRLLGILMFMENGGIALWDDIQAENDLTYDWLHEVRNCGYVTPHSSNPRMWQTTEVGRRKFRLNEWRIWANRLVGEGDTIDTTKIPLADSATVAGWKTQ